MAAPALAGDRLGASSFQSVADLWHHRVGSTPDTTAMYYRKAGRWVAMTWREADARVQRIAHALLSLGLAPEQRCCIIAETCVEWILADIAILNAGGAATTLYPTSTPEEFAYIIADCDARVAFCDTEEQVEKLRGIRDRLPHLEQVVVFHGSPSEDGWVTTLPLFEEQGGEHAAREPDAYAAAHRDIAPDRLATLMYTSGTTGEPKGVMLTHDAWVYEGEAIDALGFMTPADKQYLFLPLAHVFAKVMEISFIRLGIPTVVDGARDELVANLQATRPTTMAAVPRVFEKFHSRILDEARSRGRASYRAFRWAISVGRQVSALRQRGQEPTGLLKLRFALADRMVYSRIKEQLGGRIRFFISGGAPLSREIAEFFHACDILILEGYGLTESSAASCVNRLEDYRFGTVGRSLPGCRVKVAEDGELLIHSRGVMTGYYGRPDETRAALTDDGWLHTGDIGQILDGGHVVITGRKKDIIVTAGGKNIAPAHFEGLLGARCPFVSQVVMHGDLRPYCTALIAIDEATVAPWARGHQIPFADYADLASRAEVVALIQECVDEVNRALPPFEQVKRIALLPEDLTRANGALTATLKVKRAVVEGRHRDLLESLYDASDTLP